jgi:hypothetical protein
MFFIMGRKKKPSIASPELLENLERDLPKMQRGDRLYNLLKSALTQRGNWKNLPRGNGGDASNLVPPHKRNLPS